MDTELAPATRSSRRVMRRAHYAVATDGELVAACRSGDQLAWDTLVQRHTRGLWAIARYCGLDHASAQDVVQTAWANLCRRLDHIENDDAVRGWLNTTVRNEAIKVCKRTRRPPVSDDATTYEPRFDEPLIEAEEVAVLRAGFAQLPAELQELLTLLFAEPDPCYREIAARIGRSVGSLGPTRARALAKLRKILEADAEWRALA
jgi:RNA polymerase sigma factor (sigma-70 family)